MRYAKIRKMDISNGIGIGVSLFIQGCHFHCPECHNPEQWNFSGGELFTEKESDIILSLIDFSHITRFSILGGEPLEPCNYFELSKLISTIKKKKPEIKIWLYTGYTYEYLREEAEENSVKYLQYILKNIDILVDGQFIQEKKDISYKYAGSTNQRVIDMNKTFKNHIVKLDL